MLKKEATPLVKTPSIKKGGWEKHRYGTFVKYVSTHFVEGVPAYLPADYTTKGGKVTSTITVHFDQFAHCCGIYEMGSFPVLDEVEAEIPVRELVRLINTIASSCKYVLVVNLIENQDGWFEAFGESKSYKLVNDYVNPNTGNRVYTFMSIKK